MPWVQSTGPLAQTFPSILHVLHQLLEDSEPKATSVVIAGTKKDFLESFNQVLQARDNSLADEPENSEHDTTQAPNIDSLLVPTFAHLARSASISLHYTPTLQHFRAYLATYRPEHGTRVECSSSRQQQQLVVLNLLSLHRRTSEWSAQGLARSLAVVVDVAGEHGFDLFIAESMVSGSFVEHGRATETLWSELFPVLSGSLSEWDDEELSASTRMVSIRTVVERWFSIIDLAPQDPSPPPPDSMEFT